MNPIVKSFFDEPTNTVTYLVQEPQGTHCALIDAVLNYDPKSGRTSTESADEIIDYIRSKELQLDWILETHAHADHLSSAPYIKSELGGKTAIGEHITDVQKVFGKLFNVENSFRHDGSQFDQLFADGDTFSIGDMHVTAVHTPGHTPACITYAIGNAVFVGDTLFMPDYGTARADFPGGDARTLYHSIQKLFQLPDDTHMYLCHDYKAPGRDDYLWQTTIGEQKQNNIHVGHGKTEEDFVKMRSDRDKTLSMPTLLLPAIQVNMRAGEPPPPEENDVRYLKIPWNQL